VSGWLTSRTPTIYPKKQVESKMTMPDWRITCIFIDRDYHKKGLFFYALKAPLRVDFSAENIYNVSRETPNQSRLRGDQNRRQIKWRPIFY
jgi:hypothetical protein